MIITLRYRYLYNNMLMEAPLMIYLLGIPTKIAIGSTPGIAFAEIRMWLDVLHKLHYLR